MDFQYVVLSCTAINILRTTEWGLPAVTCVSQAELDAALDQIGVFVDFRYSFFDASFYH